MRKEIDPARKIYIPRDRTLIDLTDRTFGYWLVLAPHQFLPKGLSTWLCRCVCGIEKPVSGSSLRTGASKSCGCKRPEMLRPQFTTHGHSGDVHGYGRTTEYIAWLNMKNRCLNPKDPGYADYGGRGITVCERWRNSFENFLADIGLKPDPKLWLERIENNGDYEPGNCKWATTKEQYINRRPNKEKQR